ncbi:hypothetical protein [Pseudarthrobacter siccitolerans]
MALSGFGEQRLSCPTSDESSPRAGGVMQNFQFGKISWNPVTGSTITKGGIGLLGIVRAGSGPWHPTTDDTPQCQAAASCRASSKAKSLGTLPPARALRKAAPASPGKSRKPSR